MKNKINSYKCKQFVAFICLMVMIFTILSANAIFAAAESIEVLDLEKDVSADVYVSPNGNDNADGSAASPVATLNKAAELARVKNNGGSKSVTVSVAQGKYFVSEALTLSSADSNVSWIADGEVILTGAKTLSGLNWSNYSANSAIKVADVEAGLPIDQLFIEGEQQIMARYPNYDADATLQGSTSQSDIKSRSANWSDPAGGYIRALHDFKWGGNSYIITGKANNSIGLSYEWIGDNNRGSGMHSSFVMVENIFEELDSPGEWYYDKISGKLYVMPMIGVTLSADTLVEAAVTAELIHIQGIQDGAQATNISFDGFILESTPRTMFTGTYVPLMRGDWCVVRSGALFLQDAENVTFKNGTIRNIGGNGIFLSGHCKNIVIDNNEILNIGSSGVLVAGLPDSCREPSFWNYTSPIDPETDTNYVHKTTIEDTTAGPAAEHYPRECTISNNHIKNVGIWEKQSSQVALSVAYKIKVLSNTINEGPRAGINVNDGTFGGHEIAYNDVFDVQKETDDHGMFNSWGRDRFWSLGGFDTIGTNGASKEPYSRIDCIDPILIHDNRFHFGGRVDGGSTFGIDLDDGSSNYDIYNNLCLNMGLKLREGFYRKVHNNIFVNGVLSINCTFEDAHDEIYGNIVIKGNPYSMIYSGEDRFSVSEDIIDKNWYYDLGYIINMPDFWSNLGYDTNSIIGTIDPQFKNPANNDYTVLNTETAAAIGFENFSMTQFGKPGCEDVCPIYLKTSPDSNVDVLQKETWLGATISALDETIMTVAGSGSLNGVYMFDVPEDAQVLNYGLAEGDVIHAINGIEIIKKSEFLPIYNALQDGSVINLRIVRNQLTQELNFIKNEGTMTMIDDADQSVVYGGEGWTHTSPDLYASNSVDCYNATLSYQDVSGKSDKSEFYVEMEFTGYRVQLYGRKAGNMKDYNIEIKEANGNVVVSTTANAYSATQQDQQLIYDSENALSQGTYIIRAWSKDSSYIILDAFGVYNSTTGDVNLVTGPVNVTCDNDRVTSLESGKTLNIEVPVWNTSNTARNVQISAVLYDGAGLQQQILCVKEIKMVAAKGTEKVSLTVALPQNVSGMGLKILITDVDTGKPLAYPYYLEGNAVTDAPEQIYGTSNGEISLTYDASTKLVTVSLNDLYAKTQAVLWVKNNNNEVVALYQTTVNNCGVAEFALTLDPADNLTFIVDPELKESKSKTVTLSSDTNIVDNTALADAVEEVKTILETTENELLYTSRSWKNLKTACEAAEALLKDTNATQADIQAKLEALNKAKKGLVFVWSYDNYYDAHATAVNATSSAYAESHGFYLHTLMDRVTSGFNGWSAEEGVTDAWVTIDLQGVWTIGAIKMAPREGFDGRLPGQCEIYISDTAPTYSGSSVTGYGTKVADLVFSVSAPEQLLPDDTQGRYVTIHVKSVNGGTCINVSEIAMKLKTSNEGGSLQSITVTQNPTKTEYVKGETLDVTGLVVEGVYSCQPDWTEILTGNGIGSAGRVITLDQAVTARYLRLTLLSTLNNGNDIPCIAEIMVYNSATGQNIALSAIATAISEHNSNLAASKVNDGDINNRWASENVFVSTGGLPAWVQLTWNEEVTFDKIVIYEWKDSTRANAWKLEAATESTFTRPLEADEYTITPTGEMTTLGNMTYTIVSKVDSTITATFAVTVVDSHVHTEEVIPAVTATCTETGLTQGMKCSECGEILVEQKTTPANGHSWVGAYCDNPQTCTACGATEGSAPGHSWRDANCETPKYCIFCGATDGEPLGHNYSDGKCKVCGSVDPEYNPPVTEPDTPGLTPDENTHEDCDGGFFANLWNAIINFFRSLFGMPERCVCGEELQ